MSYVRSSGYRLKDPEDDAAFQVMVGDLERQALNLYRGTPNSAYVLNNDASNNVAIAGGASTQVTNTIQQTLRQASQVGLCYVKRSTTYTYTTTLDTLIFDTVVDDTRSTYNTSTGTFTAPVNGIYSLSMLVKNRTPAMLSLTDFDWQAYYSLTKNGTALHETVESLKLESSGVMAGNNDVPMVMSIGLRLAMGDLITLASASNYDAIGSTRYGTMRSGSFFSASWTAT